MTRSSQLLLILSRRAPRTHLMWLSQPSAYLTKMSSALTTYAVKFASHLSHRDELHARTLHGRVYFQSHLNSALTSYEIEYIFRQSRAPCLHFTLLSRSPTTSKFHPRSLRSRVYLPPHLSSTLAFYVVKYISRLTPCSYIFIT